MGDFFTSWQCNDAYLDDTTTSTTLFYAHPSIHLQDLKKLSLKGHQSLIMSEKNKNSHLTLVINKLSIDVIMIVNNDWDLMIPRLPGKSHI